MARMRQQLVTDKPWSEGPAVMPPRATAPATRFNQAAGEGEAGPGDVLRRAMEQEVIPRLLMARLQGRASAGRKESKRLDGPLPSAKQVAGLVDLLLTRDAPASATFVDAMRALGTPAESLYLDLLTPAARELGVMWEEDTCSFSEVTLGLLRLHNIMRALEPDFMGDPEIRLRGPRALLIQMPGEQHGLGLGMVVQFFRRAGWNVWNEPVATSSDLIDMLRHRAVALVGISVSCSERLDTLAADIRAIRLASRNRAYRRHGRRAAVSGPSAACRHGRGGRDRIRRERGRAAGEDPGFRRGTRPVRLPAASPGPRAGNGAYGAVLGPQQGAVADPQKTSQ